jgi:hypothetical protein
MIRRPQRNQFGISIVELGASLMFGLPLLVFTMYAVLEANYYFAITGQMELAARRGAAVQAAWYAKKYPTAAVCMSDQCNGNVSLDIPGFVNHNDNQFTITFSTDISSPPGPVGSPYSVTVNCHYPPGGDPANGLLAFPTIDPLGLGPYLSSVAPINATATFNVVPEQ